MAALFALPMAFAGRSEAHEDHAAPPAVFGRAEQYAPTPVPDRVVLTWSGDPRTTADITWRTDLTADTPRVEWIDAAVMRGDHGTGGVPGSQSAPGQSETFTTDLGDQRVHSARITALSPSTMYAYRVGDGRHWSEWHQFRTAADSDEPFTFVYFGDAQNAVRSLWSRVIREANQHAPRAAFMLHAGDLINHANRDAEWGEWFGAGGWLNGMTPSLATPGNHEYSHGLSRHWRQVFSFPLNGPPGLEETVYWLDYQGTRIVSLNSNERIETQSAWLEAVLSDPGRPKWTIVTFHHPVFSAAKERDNPKIRGEWRPILERHGVDLVLQGHDHAYARSSLGGPADLPMDEAAPAGETGANVENVADGVRGMSSNTVYVVSVSGPKMYPLQEKWDVSRAASGVQLFQVIHVAPDAIDYEARLATGELYDAFKLTKDGDGVSTLTESLPDTPEVHDRQ